MSTIHHLNKLRAFLRTLEMPKTFDEMPRNEADNTFKKLQTLYNLSSSFINNYEKTGANVKNDKLSDVAQMICQEIYYFFEVFNDSNSSIYNDLKQAISHYNQAIKNIYCFFATDAEE